MLDFDAIAGAGVIGSGTRTGDTNVTTPSVTLTISRLCASAMRATRTRIG